MRYRTKTVLAVLALLSCSVYGLDQEEESSRVSWTSQLEQQAASATTSGLRWVHTKSGRFPWYFDATDKRPSDKNKVRYPKNGQVQDHALPQPGERKNRRSRLTRSPTRRPTRSPTRRPTRSPTRRPTRSPTRSPISARRRRRRAAKRRLGTCPSFTRGDGSGGREKKIGSRSSGSACVRFVKSREPKANGATWGPGNKYCYAEFGMTGQNNSPSWRSCKFGGNSAPMCSGATVLLKGSGGGSIGKYFHSNSGEGKGMSWGGKNTAVNWKVEWSGALRSGKDVFLYGKGVRKYFHSNAGEKKGMSWGGKNSAVDWKLEWNGAFKSGSVVYLKSACGSCANQGSKYFASNHGEGKGMSWGGKSSSYAWTMEVVKTNC